MVVDGFRWYLVVVIGGQSWSIVVLYMWSFMSVDIPVWFELIVFFVTSFASKGRCWILQLWSLLVVI